MKKNLILLLLNSALLILNSACLAQQTKIDSLLNLLKKDKPDTNKVIHSNKLCWEFGRIGLYDSAIFYGNYAMQLSQQLNFKKGIANSSNNIGNMYLGQNNYPLALNHFLKALKLHEELQNKNGIVSNLSNIGIVYWNKGDYNKALDYYFKALKSIPLFYRVL